MNEKGADKIIYYRRGNKRSIVRDEAAEERTRPLSMSRNTLLLLRDE